MEGGGSRFTVSGTAALETLSIDIATSRNLMTPKIRTGRYLDVCRFRRTNYNSST